MNIVIVDDDKFVSLSLKTILEAQEDINVLAVGESGKEAVELYEKHSPDVLLMDIRMENMTGLEALDEILQRNSDAKILLLTTFSDDEYIVKAILSGAKGYILKQEFSSIAPALRAVNNGQTVFGTEIMDRIPHLFSRDMGDSSDNIDNSDNTCSSNTDSGINADNNGKSNGKRKMDTNNKDCEECLAKYDINEKELSIIELIAEGLNNKEIAEELFLSEGTVRNYISTILEKIALRDRTQLACFYYKNLV